MSTAAASGAVVATAGAAAVERAQVLVIGLDPFRVPWSWHPAPVAEAIEPGTGVDEDQGWDEGTVTAVELEHDRAAPGQAAMCAGARARVLSNAASGQPEGWGLIAAIGMNEHRPSLGMRTSWAGLTHGARTHSLANPTVAQATAQRSTPCGVDPVSCVRDRECLR